MENTKADIQRLVEIEAEAWNTQDTDKLLGILHPDMVWPWPLNPKDHDPVNWVLSQGKYDYNRWKKNWQELFDNYKLVHNVRHTIRIEISKELDGAFAVVDIDTLWEHSSGEQNHWKGRVCKIYSKTGEGWKMISQIGALDYSLIH